MNEVAQKVKDRLFEFIAYLGLNNSAFEKKCGLSNGYIRNFKGNLGGKKLEDILIAFPQLNKDWLLFGKGSMLINSENQPENPMTEQPEEKRMIDTLLFLVESQKKDIETLIQLVKEKDTKIDELLTLAQDKDERIGELLTLAQYKDERIDELLTLAQEKDERIEELLTLTQDRDERIEELLDEINARKRGDATNAARSSSASAI